MPDYSPRQMRGWRMLQTAVGGGQRRQGRQGRQVAPYISPKGLHAVKYFSVLIFGLWQWFAEFFSHKKTTSACCFFAAFSAVAAVFCINRLTSLDLLGLSLGVAATPPGFRAFSIEPLRVSTLWASIP